MSWIIDNHQEILAAISMLVFLAMGVWILYLTSGEGAPPENSKDSNDE